MLLIVDGEITYKRLTIEPEDMASVQSAHEMLIDDAKSLHYDRVNFINSYGYMNLK